MKRNILIIGGLVFVAIVAFFVYKAVAPSKPINVQLLALNDFHGNLLPPSGSSGQVDGVDAGGVEYLATHIDTLRGENPNTVVVSAGDLVGASPLLSALFHDEPTIEAFNLIGLDFNAVGNHEFDEGWAELKRLQEGGCHPVDGCLDGDDFSGAEFKFLAANVINKETSEPIFPAYEVREFEGVKIAFIGMTLKGTPSIVTPSGVADLEFLDEAETVNALIPELQAQGIETIVVLVHEGARQNGDAPTANTCQDIDGPIVDIVSRFDDAVDVVISGHTHQAYNCLLDGKLLTSAMSFGRLVTQIHLTIDPKTGDVTTMEANNLVVTRDVEKASLLTALIERYNKVAEPLANHEVGTITTDILREPNDAGEMALGDVIADSQLFATSAPDMGNAVIAFMNPGGIRADLVYADSVGEGDGTVTFGEIFTVQPFNNNLVTLTLTGEQIDALLEQQFVDCGQTENPRILQVSKGFSYTWKASGAPCEKVDPATIFLNDEPIDPAKEYRVTVNSYLADGGDRFKVLTEGTDRLVGVMDLDALEAYMLQASPVEPGAQDRIKVIP